MSQSYSGAFKDAIIGARFLSKLPFFLRHPVTLDEAKKTLGGRFANRERDFLRLVETAVYNNATSPYLKLLQFAGCEYQDVETLVHKDGVEGALQNLFSNGVFLTLEEFKGRAPIQRGNTTIDIQPEQLLNTRSQTHFYIRTAASSGQTGGLVPMDLAYVRERSINESLVLDAWGGSNWRHAIWGVPGGSAMNVLLRLCGCGIVPDRWFSQVELRSRDLRLRYYWSARATYWIGQSAGLSLPYPDYVPAHEPLTIVAWMQSVLESGGVPNLWVPASAAVRLSSAARREGIDLTNARFTLGGDPLTEARSASIRQSGALGLSTYGAVECGRIGEACLAPEMPDDVHLFHDLHALIQPGSHAPEFGLPPRSLLVSSIRQTDPILLLNASLGDHAFISERECGCPLEKLGWRKHIYTIRSHDKMTAAGMTFADSVMVPVLEEVLPMFFGGGPGDYQLMESDDADGNLSLRLLVDPSVGPIDETRVRERFLETISSGSGPERIMGTVWRQLQLVTVERRTPVATRRGKILHLHVEPTPKKAK